MENLTISKYVTTRKLGLGEMCTIYAAHEIDNPNVKVVVKVFSPELAKNKEFKDRFLQKIDIVKNINHKNVVPLLDYLLDENNLVLINEFVEGQNLKFAVSMKNFTRDQNIEYFKQILSGITYLHSLKLIHRSLDPSNIFFTDNYKTVKILDAGIADIFEYDNPQKMKILSPMFLSPEQILQNQPITELSDIYTLGVLLYFMLSRKTPFAKTSSYSDICKQITNNPVPLLPRNEILNQIIAKATHKKPKERFQNCDEFLNALNQL